MNLISKATYSWLQVDWGEVTREHEKSHWINIDPGTPRLVRPHNAPKLSPSMFEQLSAHFNKGS